MLEQKESSVAVNVVFCLGTEIGTQTESDPDRDGDYELMIGTMIRTTCTYFQSAVYFIMIPLLNMKNEPLIFCSLPCRGSGNFLPNRRAADLGREVLSRCRNLIGDLLGIEHVNLENLKGLPALLSSFVVDCFPA